MSVPPATPTPAVHGNQPETSNPELSNSSSPQLPNSTRSTLRPPNSEPPKTDTDDLQALYITDVEFRQETIYFIIVDRFHDGDPSNSEGPNQDLYDPQRQDWGKYWGGDLQGIIDKLDYLQAMGITALWLNPLFEQVEYLSFESAAIHGYWTKDFKRINPRLIATTDDPSLFRTKDTVFDRLIAELHQRGMKLILDIVCNHSSPPGDGNAGNKGELYDDGVLVASFDNDVNHWYHHYGEVTNWEDEWQVQNCELAGLATFNENNIDYRNYIKAAIKLWLDRGVDALRVDTVKHMPIWFWQEFVSDIKTHKPDTFIFGEWIYSHPLDERSLTFANHSGMNILDFGLCMAIRSALANDEEAGFHLIQDILDQDYRYNNITELVTFIDNHDMHRFQTLNPDPNRLRLAIDLIMTCRGIPCIYYGTEQYLHNDTNATPEVYGNNDPYNRPMMEQWDPQTAVYRDVRTLSALRRLNPAISLGSQTPILVTDHAFGYMRRYRDSRCLVLMNKGEATVIESLAVDLPDRDYLCALTHRKITVQSGQISNLELDSHEVIVLSRVGQRVRGKTIVRVQLNGLATQPDERIVVTGDCPELGNWDITQAYPLEYINRNNWFGEIPFNQSAGQTIAYKYAIVRADIPVRENLTCRRWKLAEEGVVKWRDTWNG